MAIVEQWEFRILHILITIGNMITTMVCADVGKMMGFIYFIVM